MKFYIAPQGNNKYAVVSYATGQVRYSGHLAGAREAQAKLNNGSWK